MSKWFYANLLLFFIATWRSVIHDSLTNIHISMGFAGFLLFIFNWTRQPIFSTIRKTSSRKIKVKLAALSKKIVPFHRWTGTTALVLVIFHACLVIHQYGIQPRWNKWNIGFVAGMILTSMVISGWIRLCRPSVNKRKWHIYNGMILFFIIFIHLLL